MARRFDAGKKAKVRGPFKEHVRKDKLLERHGGLCGICGEPVNPYNFTIDHAVPISKGGVHAYWNCQPAHALCNKLKGNLMPEQVALILPLINRRRKKNRYRNNGMAYRRNKAA